MKVTKIIAVFMSALLVFLCCGCSQGGEEALLSTSSKVELPQSTKDIIALASAGEIPELPVKIGTDIETLAEVIIESGNEVNPDMTDDELMRYELNTVTTEGEETAPLFFYKKGYKEQGVSIIVATGEAYGLLCGSGTDADYIINWVGKNVKVERAPTTEEDIFFFNGIVSPENKETLTYQVGDYILKFIVDNQSYKNESGQDEITGLLAVTLTNPKALSEEE